MPTMARPTSPGSISAGDSSRKIRPDSRRSPKLAHSINPATPRPASGSKRSHPVTMISPAATAVPAKAARSVAKWTYAPRTFRAAMARGREDPGGQEVDRRARQRDGEDEPGVDVRRRGEPASGRVDDPESREPQRHAVDLRR